MFSSGAVYAFDWGSLSLNSKLNRAKQTRLQHNDILSDVTFVTLDKFRNSFGWNIWYDPLIYAQ
jgi:hypothetical protein